MSRNRAADTQKEACQEEEEEGRSAGSGRGGGHAPECFGSAVHDARVALCENIFVIFCELEHVFEDQSLAARVRRPRWAVQKPREGIVGSSQLLSAHEHLGCDLRRCGATLPVQACNSKFHVRLKVPLACRTLVQRLGALCRPVILEGHSRQHARLLCKDT